MVERLESCSSSGNFESAPPHRERQAPTTSRRASPLLATILGSTDVSSQALTICLTVCVRTMMAIWPAGSFRIKAKLHRVEFVRLAEGGRGRRETHWSLERKEWVGFEE